MFRKNESLAYISNFILAMYHYYSTNPKSYVWNNEFLINDTTEDEGRIKRNIEKPWTSVIDLATN